MCYYMEQFCGRFPEWPKGADCKSVSYAFEGSNPSSPRIWSLPFGKDLFYFYVSLKIYGAERRKKCRIFQA